MPASAAAASAPSRILTKKGLVSVSVIRQAETPWLSAMTEPAEVMAASAVPISNFFMMSSQNKIWQGLHPARSTASNARRSTLEGTIRWGMSIN